MDYKLIGQRIREARKAKGITQKELGAAISRTESSVAKYEQGLVEIPTSQLQAIASALGINWYELYAESEKEQIEAKKNYDIAKFLSEKRKGVKVEIIGKDGKTEFRDITIDDYFELFEEI